jgi:O-antigen/teichoic acid export membrane protein
VEGRGAYAVALLLPTLLTTFLNFGISSANVYYLASRQIDVRTALIVTFAFSMTCTVLGLGIGWVSTALWGEVLFPGVGQYNLLLALASFPFLFLLQMAGGLLQGVQDFRAFNVTLLAPPAVTLAAIAVLASTGSLDLGTLLISYLLGLAVGVFGAAHALLLRPELRQRSLSNNIKRWHLSQLLRYGLKAYASNLVTFFNYRADLFLVNLFLGPSAAGIYVVAMQFGERLWLISQAISTVFLPKISELSGNEAERGRFTSLVSRWTLFLTLLAALGLGLVFKPLVHLLMGGEFSAATWVLWLLLPGIVAWAPARVLANDIAGRGRPEINLLIAFVVMISNLFGNLVLILFWGLPGAAISTSVAYCVMLLMTARSYTVLTGTSWRTTMEIRLVDFKSAKFFLYELWKNR